MGERALQGEADCEACGAEDGDKARCLDTELRQCRQHGNREDQIAREAPEEASQHRVEIWRSSEHPIHEHARPAREPQANDQDEGRTEHRQRSADDERQQRMHVDDEICGFSLQHPNLLPRTLRGSHGMAGPEVYRLMAAAAEA